MVIFMRSPQNLFQFEESKWDTAVIGDSTSSRSTMFGWMQSQHLQLFLCRGFSLNSKLRPPSVLKVSLEWCSAIKKRFKMSHYEQNHARLLARFQESYFSSTQVANTFESRTKARVKVMKLQDLLRVKYSSFVEEQQSKPAPK